MKKVDPYILSLLLVLISITPIKAQDTTKPARFVEVYMPYVSNYSKAPHFTAYFSNGVEQDMSALLGYPSENDLKNKSILSKYESNLLAYFYDRGYELIGVAHLHTDAVREYYFKMKNEK